MTQTSSRNVTCPNDRAPRRGFSLTEMLVVIGIIALLIGILLPALSRVQDRARKTQTENLLQEFAKACEAFYQQFGFYPGIVPEAILNSTDTPQISGAENALLHLCGGAIPEDDPLYGQAPYNGWTELTFGNAAVGTFKIKVNAAKVGEGPRIRGTQYKSFFSPKASDFLPTKGQFLTSSGNEDPYASDPLKLPDLLDAWGQPVLYFRQLRPQGATLVAGGMASESLADAVFAFQGANPYLVSGELGEYGRNQGDSILRLVSNTNRSATLAQILRNVSFGAPSAPLQGAPRGAFAIISAGRDGIFFSRYDGPGTQSAPKTDIVTAGANPTGPYIVAEYDDVRVFGGN
ncbi:MAG: prepilin-type N-terminal cleavage/methylation domain-containing protein [Planctomycetaceae bacterium]|nr:prepilin-type N-terminal cleavage/methylation domain-containing protein [Planctomycetaceae bacterium]